MKGSDERIERESRMRERRESRRRIREGGEEEERKL